MVWGVAFSLSSCRNGVRVGGKGKVEGGRWVAAVLLRQGTFPSCVMTSWGSLVRCVWNCTMFFACYGMKESNACMHDGGDEDRMNGGCLEGMLCDCCCLIRGSGIWGR